MIRFFCPLCGARILAPDWKAGRRGKCAGCRQKVPVPRESDPADDMPSADSESEPAAPASVIEEVPAPAWQGPWWDRRSASAAAEAPTPPARQPSPEPPAPRVRKLSLEAFVGLAAVFGITVVLVYYATVLVWRHLGTRQEKVWPLQEVVAQFQENRAQALEEIRGKQLKISSTVVEHRVSLDGPVTVLGSQEHPVYCVPIPAYARDFQALPPGEPVVLLATVSQRGIAMLPPLPPGRKMTLDEIHAAIQNGALPQAKEEAPGGFTLRDARLVERKQ